MQKCAKLAELEKSCTMSYTTILKTKFTAKHRLRYNREAAAQGLVVLATKNNIENYSHSLLAAQLPTRLAASFKYMATPLDESK